MEYRIGCSGWSYEEWKEVFYPKDLEKLKWLSFYSEVFDFVEIDSTFYNIPKSFIVNSWSKKTPSNFAFSSKFPRLITHEKKFKHIEMELDNYLKSLLPLKSKLITLLIQLPPYLDLDRYYTDIEQFFSILDKSFRYSIEVRDKSWFCDKFYHLLKDNNICLVWNQLDIIQAPPIITTDFVYIRLIGDRSIKEKDFGKIVKDKIVELKHWSDIIMGLPNKDEHIQSVIVAANNHFAGFGPQTANTFRELLGLDSLSWTEKDSTNITDESKTNLITLNDFFR